MTHHMFSDGKHEWKTFLPPQHFKKKTFNYSRKRLRYFLQQISYVILNISLIICSAPPHTFFFFF